MGFLVKAARRMEGLFRPSASLTEFGSVEELAQAIGLAMNGGPTKSGVSVNSKRAEQVAAVYACIRVLADSVAQLPLVLYQKDGKSRLPMRDDPLFQILHSRPNDWQTQFEWIEMMQRDLLMRGNAYSLKVMGVGGRLLELIRLHPDRVTPKQNPLTLEVTYEVTGEQGKKTTLHREEMFHVRGPGDDGLIGMSPIQCHRETIGDSIATQEHGSRFFSNGAKLLGVIEMEPGASFNSDDSERSFKRDFESTHQGGENAHKTAILPAGTKYKPVSITMRDAQYLELRKFQRSDIAGIFRVPPHMIGDLEKSTNNNIEHQGLGFVIHSLAPWLVRWEQAIDRDLLDNDPSRFVKFNANGLLRGDFKSRNEGLNIQRRAGIITANEWRELEDMNPRSDPGGDDYIVEVNMRPDDGRNPTEGSETL